MKIDVCIQFRPEGNSPGSAVSIVKGNLLICNFQVRQEGIYIVVDFLHEANSKNPSELELAAGPLIIKKYQRRLAMEKKRAKKDAPSKPLSAEAPPQSAY